MDFDVDGLSDGELAKLSKAVAERLQRRKVLAAGAGAAVGGSFLAGQETARADPQNTESGTYGDGDEDWNVQDIDANHVASNSVTTGVRTFNEGDITDKNDISALIGNRPLVGATPNGEWLAVQAANTDGVMETEFFDKEGRRLAACGFHTHLEDGPSGGDATGANAHFPFYTHQESDVSTVSSPSLATRLSIGAGGGDTNTRMENTKRLRLIPKESNPQVFLDSPDKTTYANDIGFRDGNGNLLWLFRRETNNDFTFTNRENGQQIVRLDDASNDFAYTGDGRLSVEPGNDTGTMEIFPDDGNDAILQLRNGGSNKHSLRYDDSADEIILFEAGEGTVFSYEDGGGDLTFERDTDHGLNVDHHDAQDVTAISSPEPGDVAYHDGSGNAGEGIAYYDGSNWNVLDGGTQP
jgi:hypothetical protein